MKRANFSNKIREKENWKTQIEEVEEYSWLIVHLNF